MSKGHKLKLHVGLCFTCKTEFILAPLSLYTTTICSFILFINHSRNQLSYRTPDEPAWENILDLIATFDLFLTVNCILRSHNNYTEMTFCANLGEWFSNLGSFTIPFTFHAVVCLSLPPLNNGIVSYNDLTLGLDTVATYTCDTGYTLNGVTTRTCGSDGVWSGANPVCQCKWI